MAGFMYFKDSGIQGEATESSLLEESNQPNGLKKDEYYKGWIRLNSVRQEITRDIESGGSGTTRSRAGTVMKEVDIEKEVDSASMRLISACSGGTPFPHVFIHLCTSIVNDDGYASLHPFLEFHLYSVKVTKYEIEASGVEEGHIPTESLSLNYDKILWRYFPIGPTPEKPDTLPNAVQKFHHSGWDVLRSAPFDG